MKTRICILLCAALLAACGSVPQRIAALPTYGDPKPILTMKVPYPIILLHGLGQKSHVWNGAATQYFSKELNLSLGGHLTTTGPIASPTVRNDRPTGNTDADYYILSFRSSHDSITAWRNEVDATVKYVLNETGADKVILIGYSMGGLAARAYMTHRLTDHHVKRLITIGTPHLGSVYAKVWSLDSTLSACMTSSNPVVSAPCKTAYSAFKATEGDMPYNAPAIRDLRRPEDGGYYLRALGKYTHPLDVEYISVIGEVELAQNPDKLSTGFLQEVIRRTLTLIGGDPGLIFEAGDGVVSTRSQNIMNIEFFNINPKNKRAARTISVNSVHIRHLEQNYDVQRASLDEKPEFANASMMLVDGEPSLVIDIRDHIPMLCSLGVFATPNSGGSVELAARSNEPELIKTRDGIVARYIVPINNTTLLSANSIVFRYLIKNTFGYTVSGSLEW